MHVKLLVTSKLTSAAEWCVVHEPLSPLPDTIVDALYSGQLHKCEEKALQSLLNAEYMFDDIR